MVKLFKILAWSILILALAAGIVIYASPYRKHEGFGYRLIKTSVEIDKPVAAVFQYLGNSDNAARWSVFVDHIVPLNADSFSDGEVGSRRRVFCYADEQGQRWDELISEKEINKRRQLELYNYVDFPMTAPHLATEQIYEALSPGRTKLTFTVFYKNYQPTIFELLKTYLGAYKIEDIFEQNMHNIKKFVEAIP